MTINGVNISTFQARQHKVAIGHADAKNNSTWITSALLPHRETGYIGFKQVTVEFIVSGSGRAAIIENRSKLLAAVMNPATVDLDGFSHHFNLQMRSHKEDEVVRSRYHKVTVVFDGYEYGDEVFATGTGSVTATNPGTLPSPARLVLVPARNATSVQITGLCRNPRTGADLPVILDTVTSGVQIILDGANGLFVEGDSLKPDITIKAPPGVAPGSATVECSDSTAALTLEILPLYM